MSKKNEQRRKINKIVKENALQLMRKWNEMENEERVIKSGIQEISQIESKERKRDVINNENGTALFENAFLFVIHFQRCCACYIQFLLLFN